VTDYTTSASALRCKECERVGELTAAYVCEYCFGPLEVLYDTERIGAVVSRERIATGPPSLWRYRDFLPCAPQDPTAGLPSGLTPLVRAPRLAEELGLRDVWVKNDTANPTHSFKDRVVSVALEKAKELGYRVVACASTGNLANSVAAHASAHGLESYVFVPADLEEQKIVATAVYGTTLVAVAGVYDDVNRLCM
jgi:threonine synthase